MIFRTRSRLGPLSCWSLAAFIHSEQLGDGHEFESFREKGIKNLRHRRNRRRVDIM
jgi:hypothetical protein